MERVHIPKDREGIQRTYGFVTFKHECSVPYSLALFEETTLFNKPLRLRSRNCTNNDIHHVMNDTRGSERQRTQSLPNNLDYTMIAPTVPDYNMLLQLGQQMLIPSSFGLGSSPVQANQFSAYLPSNSSPVYRSQLNSSYYLGGSLEKLSQNSRDIYGHNINYPFPHGSHGGGSRGHERNHDSNSHHSNLHHHHRHRDDEHRGRSRKRRY